MKRTFVLAILAVSLFAMNGFAQKIKGSDTCLPLTQLEAETYMKS